MKFTLFSAILLSIGCMSFVAAGNAPPPICCLTVTNTKPPFENIVKYEMQDPVLCRIRAVRFYTKRSTVICSDPDSKYAKTAMDIVDGRTATTPTICYSTTNTIPAVTTTNKRPGTKTETFTGDGRPPDCCFTVTDTKPPFENIVKYEMQNPRLCGIRAVRFYTKKNKVVCSDPESKYAKRAMDIVDGRTTATPTICYTSTTNTIPAVTTTNKTPGKKAETSTSTTASRTVTRIETSSPETETSTSTTASQTVTRIETSSPETVITKTTNQAPPMSKENPKSSFSTATCGTGGPTSSSTETKRKTPGPGTVTHPNTLKTTDNTESTSPMRTKPSKLKKKILRKNSNKKLKRFQMNIHLKNKSG